MLASGPSALSLLIWEVKSNLVTVFFTEHLLYGDSILRASQILAQVLTIVGPV